MSIVIFSACFYLFAFAAACLYSYAHRAAGAPSLNEHGLATANSGMILSFYGLWLARKFNDWQAAYMVRIADKERQKLELEKHTDSTAYRILLDSAKPYLQSQGLPLEALSDAMIERHIVTQRTSEQAQIAYHLNPFKALGVCGLCSAFWFYTPLYALGIVGLYQYGWLPADGYLWHAFAGLFFAPVAFAIQTKIVE